MSAGEDEEGGAATAAGSEAVVYEYSGVVIREAANS